MVSPVRDRPPRGPAAAPVAVSEAQGEDREVRAIPGPAAVRRVRSRAPGADDDKPSVGEGLICKPDAGKPHVRFDERGAET